MGNKNKLKKQKWKESKAVHLHFQNLRASHTIADNIPLVSCTSFRYTVDYIHKKCVAKSGLKLIFTYLDQDFMGDNS